MPDLMDRTLCECTSSEMAFAFRTIFRDFEVAPPPLFDGAAFERRFAFEHLDRSASRLITDRADPVATILIARRGRTSHISGLGVVPAYRRGGLARRMLSRACEEAQRRGDRRMLVEVSTTNTIALRLYESLGFTICRRLVGFTKNVSSAAAHDAVQEIDPIDVAAEVASEGPRDLPWFLHPASLAGCSLPSRAFELDGAFAIVTPRPGELHLRALYVRRDARRQGRAAALVDALAARSSSTTCLVLPFVPEGLCDEFFRATSFVEAPLVNYEMEIRF